MMLLLSALGVVTYCVIPVYLVVKLWRHRSEDLFGWTLLATVAAVYLAYMYRVGAWAMIFTGYYWRNFILAALVVSIVKSYWQARRHLLPGWCSFKNLCSLAVVGIVCITQATALYFSYKDAGQPPEAINLEFPLKGGVYCVLHGGNNELLNHHHEISAQRYAIDVVQLNQLGSRCNTLCPSNVNDYNIFGTMVHSPCDGRVVLLVDEHEDLEPGVMDPDHPAGNYLAIQMQDAHPVVILAHLMKGSCLVKEGDIVARGTPLARVGNSGNTSEPHLHLHLVENRNRDFLFEGIGIPHEI